MTGSFDRGEGLLLPLHLSVNRCCPVFTVIFIMDPKGQRGSCCFV